MHSSFVLRCVACVVLSHYKYIIDIVFFTVHLLCFFFFKQKTAYEMRISDWSSDVCSSDLSCRRVEIRHILTLKRNGTRSSATCRRARGRAFDPAINGIDRSRWNNMEKRDTENRIYGIFMCKRWRGNCSQKAGRKHSDYERGNRTD